MINPFQNSVFAIPLFMVWSMSEYGYELFHRTLNYNILSLEKRLANVFFFIIFGKLSKIIDNQSRIYRNLTFTY